MIVLIFPLDSNEFIRTIRCGSTEQAIQEKDLFSRPMALVESIN